MGKLALLKVAVQLLRGYSSLNGKGKLSSFGLWQLLKEVTPDLVYMSQTPPQSSSDWLPAGNIEFSLNESGC